MMLKISDKQMVLFLTVVVPLLILFAALLVAPNIWVIMLAILWMGVGLMMLYIPKAEG
ncbi:MAG TPA: hypothetical protein VMW85_06905 [Methanomassiliicoccales archaeon]|nr:hypothetical protein [Methanomassiliicoccales archaeon]